MTTFRISVAMDIRAYGFIEVEAETIEAATAQITHARLAKEFSPHGHGDDDFDMTHPRAVYLSDYCEDDGDYLDLEIDLPDPDWVSSAA